MRKENAYVFDFDPARTLTIYEQFANNLNPNTAQGGGTAEERKDNIKELLNFFPVIGEDEQGELVELDAEKSITITTNDDMKLKNIVDILQSKLVKRNLSLKILDAQTPENALGGNIRQVFNLKKGLTQELAKKIVSDIKATKLKVQASIQGEQVRVTGKDKDDLQAVIQNLRKNEDKYDVPLQFTNYR